MHSIKIPKEINIKIYKLKNKNSLDKYCIVLSNERSLIWFTIDGNIKVNYNWSRNELSTNNKRLKILTLKGIERITIGYLKKVLLGGVGFRGEVIKRDGEDILCLRVGKPEIEEFIIPKDVTVNVENEIVKFWSYSDRLVNNLIDKILRQVPVRKGAIKIIK